MKRITLQRSTGRRICRLVNGCAFFVLLVAALASCRYPDGVRRAAMQPPECRMKVQGSPSPLYLHGAKLVTDSGSWSYRDGHVAGSADLAVKVAEDGAVTAVINLDGRSTGFKLYAQPAFAVLFADRQGRLVHPPGRLVERVTSAVSGFGNADYRNDSRRVMFSPACGVSFVVYRFRFCGHQESFGRHNIANNCPEAYSVVNPPAGQRQRRRSPVPLDLGIAERLPQLLPKMAGAIQEETDLGGGWRGMRLK